MKGVKVGCYNYLVLFITVVGIAAAVLMFGSILLFFAWGGVSAAIDMLFG